MRANESEIEGFNENSNDFVRITEEMVEMPEFRDKSVKLAAGDFLQEMVGTVQGSLLYVVETNISIIKYVLAGEMESELIRTLKSFDFELSVEASFTILTIFS
jgi:hypothetical protein